MFHGEVSVAHGKYKHCWLALWTYWGWWQRWVRLRREPWLPAGQWAQTSCLERNALQSWLKVVSKTSPTYPKVVSVSTAQLLGTQQTSKWRSNWLETGVLSFRGQGLMASLVNCFFDRTPIHGDTTRRGRIICSSRKNGKWNQLSRDKTMYGSLFSMAS